MGKNSIFNFLCTIGIIICIVGMCLAIPLFIYNICRLQQALEPTEEETTSEWEPSIVPNIFEPVGELVEVTENEISTVVQATPKSLGTFRLTAYCPCPKCCGKWSGSPTASGVMPIEGRTIAVDTSIIPFGTAVTINGKEYIAEDTGKSIVGNRIDIYMDSHEAALEFGVQYAEVYEVN